MHPHLSFVVKPFEALTALELHDLLQLRCLVFVVEQDCAYQEVDGKDPISRHLMAFSSGQLVACARWYWLGADVILGRIVTHPDARGKGYGRQLMAAALEAIGSPTIQIHAQAHLEGFYKSFGFEADGDPFDEDGIPHLLMRRRCVEGESRPYNRVS